MWEKSKDSIWRHRRAAGPLSALALVSMLAIAAHDIKPASAQDWPTHPLTMVVPFASGGGTDVMARIVGRRMSEILGQEVIVQNKPGAGRMVGSAYVARATPDGYTLVFGSRSAAIDMTLYKHPTYSLQDSLKALDPNRPIREADIHGIQICLKERWYSGHVWHLPPPWGSNVHRAA